MSLNFRINGKIEPHEATSLTGLLTEIGVELTRKGIAVAVNGGVVPRTVWPETLLAEGDTIEIIRALSGG